MDEKTTQLMQQVQAKVAELDQLSPFLNSFDIRFSLRQIDRQLDRLLTEARYQKGDTDDN